MITYYHIAPRYTAGSPAQVTEDTARKVAAQEKAAYNRAINGMFGSYEKLRTQEKGLDGIVYSSCEIGKIIHVHDLITEHTYCVPVDKWQGHHWYNRTDRNAFIQSHQTSNSANG